MGEVTNARDESFFSELTGDTNSLIVKPSFEIARLTVPPDVINDVSTKGARRIAFQDAHLERQGFKPIDRFFAPGTVLYSSGEDNYSVSRRKFEHETWFGASSRKLEETVLDEDRMDVTVPMRSLSLDDQGQLVVQSTAYPIEDRAFAKLIARTGPDNGARALLNLPAELRAATFNAWMGYIADALEDNTVVLRTRNGDDEAKRSVFAVVSEGYTPLDTDEIAAMLAEIIPDSARGSATYDGSRSRFDALWHAPEGFDCTVGDVYRAGVQVRSGDSGDQALSVRMLIHQAICRNLTTVTQEVKVAVAIHKGQMDLAQRLRAGVDRALEGLNHFIGEWNESERMEIVEAKLHHGDVEPVFAALLRAKLVPRPAGVKEDEMLKRLRKAYWKAPSASVAGIRNAITRCAHEEAWSSPWALDDLQAAGGSMVQQRLRIVRIADRAIAEAKDQGWTGQHFTLDEAHSGVTDQAKVFAFVR